MDPNEVLAIARDRSEAIIESADALEGSQSEEAIELAEAFQALDSWLVKGGFKPRKWAK